MDLALIPHKVQITGELKPLDPKNPLMNFDASGYINKIILFETSKEG